VTIVEAGSIDVLAVNVGAPALLAESHGERVYSGIAKQPVDLGTSLWLSLGNLAGDSQADLTVHGGPDKAVYAYPSEHLVAWSRELADQPDTPVDLGPAPFGENLSTLGVTEADVAIGDQWRWDEAVLEVCQPRWPCFKLALHRGRPDVNGRMRATGRTGWYLRVLQPGVVTVGSTLEVVARDPAGLSILDAHRAMGDRHLGHRPLVEALAQHPALAAEWRQPLLDRLA
jgi:MOSC domain-containing protein YiiM